MYVVCDAEACERAGWTLVDFASAAIDGGARFLQVRAKHASARSLLDATTAIVARARAAGALVVVNDRADVARAAGAGGVHVGQDDLAPGLVRLVAGADILVGISTHTMEQLESALAEPVSYIAVGPVFATNTKATGHEQVGLAHVERARARVARERAPLPIVAIGGITLERAVDVIRAGATSVAVISDLLSTGHPAARVGQYLAALRSAEGTERTEATGTEDAEATD